MTKQNKFWRIPVLVYDFDAQHSTYNFRAVFDSQEIRVSESKVIFPETMNCVTFGELTRSLSLLQEYFLDVPAFILCDNDHDMQIYDSRGKKLSIYIKNMQNLPTFNVLHTFETPCINLQSIVAVYYTSQSGATKFLCMQSQHCITYCIPLQLNLHGVTENMLLNRRCVIHKVIRDCRVVVETPSSVSVINPFTQQELSTIETRSKRRRHAKANENEFI